MYKVVEDSEKNKVNQNIKEQDNELETIEEQPFNLADKFRLSALGFKAGNVAGSVSTNPVGEVVAGVTGITSDILDAIADVSDYLSGKMSGTDLAINTSANLGFTAASLIPGGGVAKFTNGIRKSAKILIPTLISLGVTNKINNGSYLNTAKKVSNGDFSNLTVEDYQNIFEGTTMVNSSIKILKSKGVPEMEATPSGENKGDNLKIGVKNPPIAIKQAQQLYDSLPFGKKSKDVLLEKTIESAKKYFDIIEGTLKLKKGVNKEDLPNNLHNFIGKNLEN